MTDGEHQGMLLGRQTPVLDRYAPELLYPIPRAIGRAALGLGAQLPFAGADLWHAYEISWLDGDGRPEVRVGRVSIPAASPNLVESKSFKLYLNSLNNTRFAGETEFAATVQRDIAAVVGAGIELELLGVDDPRLAGARLAGECIDHHAVAVPGEEPVADMLQSLDGNTDNEQMLVSHLLRSLCPVTGQPDWASLWIHYGGPALAQESLLRYILAFRRHQEFHEQCVERMFCDIQRRIAPRFLHIQAFYTRRGGLDINPFRSTDAAALPLPRLNRQ
jgi:7-cyano-7-deazaguanine reductase